MTAYREGLTLGPQMEAALKQSVQVPGSYSLVF